MLQRRRSNSWQAEVRERRAEVSRYMQDPAYKKQVGQAECPHEKAAFDCLHACVHVE